MSAIPVLTTPRLLMRAWRDSDRPLFATMNADTSVMQYFAAPLNTGESDAAVERIVTGWRQGYGLWAVERRDEGAFIGFVGFSQPSWEAPFTPCIEIGWRLSASSWNQGLATEGARAALVWGREHVVFPRGEVVSFTTVDNLPSRRVMEKLGMTHDPADDFDHPMLPDGARRRHVLYRLRV